MWAALSRIILRYRLAILLVIAGTTVYMGWLASKAEMNYALAQILPEDDPEFQIYSNFKQRFGEDANVIVIGVESENLFQRDFFNDWANAADSIKKIPQVKAVLSISDVYNLQRNDSLQRFKINRIVKNPPQTQHELDSLKQVMLSLPFYKDLLITKTTSGKYATVMLVTMDQHSIDSKGREQLIDHLISYTRHFSEVHKTEVHYSGLPFIRTMNSAKLKKELGMFLWMSLLVTALVLLLFFRSFKAILFPLLVVAISVVWCVGTMVLLGYQITILTALIPPLIVIIGIPNCIFLTNNFHREYKGHGNKIKAISRVIHKIGNATFLTNFNTALGFVTFAFVESKLLKEFGILSSINVMQVFVLSLTILPIAYSYISSPKPKQTKHLDNRFFDGLVEWLIQMVTKKRKWIYAITVVIVGISIWGMTKMHTTGNFTDDIPRRDKLILDLKFFEKNFHGVMPFEVAIDTKKKNGVMKLSTLRKIEQAQEILKKYPEFSKPLSIVEVINLPNKDFIAEIPAFILYPTTKKFPFCFRMHKTWI
jgi:predicted RND superfamily exporter protein